MHNLCRQMANPQKMFETFADIKSQFDRVDQFYLIKISSPHKNLLKLQRHTCEVKLFGQDIIESFYLACWQLLSYIHWQIYWSYKFKLLNTDKIEKVGERLYARLPPYFEVCYYKDYFIVNKRLKFNLKAMIEIMLFINNNFNFIDKFL